MGGLLSAEIPGRSNSASEWPSTLCAETLRKLHRRFIPKCVKFCHAVSFTLQVHQQMMEHILLWEYPPPMPRNTRRIQFRTRSLSGQHVFFSVLLTLAPACLRLVSMLRTILRSSLSLRADPFNRLGQNKLYRVRASHAEAARLGCTGLRSPQDLRYNFGKSTRICACARVFVSTRCLSLPESKIPLQFSRKPGNRRHSSFSKGLGGIAAGACSVPESFWELSALTSRHYGLADGDAEGPIHQPTCDARVCKRAWLPDVRRFPSATAAHGSSPGGTEKLLWVLLLEATTQDDASCLRAPPLCEDKEAETALHIECTSDTSFRTCQLRQPQG